MATARGSPAFDFFEAPPLPRSLQNRENPRPARKAHESSDREKRRPRIRRVSELPTPHELGQIAGRMWADELACYQEEKRAEIAATGVVPEDTRVNVEGVVFALADREGLDSLLGSLRRGDSNHRREQVAEGVSDSQPRVPQSPWPRHPTLDEREAHSPLSLRSVGCRGSVAAAVRGPQVARAVGGVIQIPRLIAPDDAATASTADPASSNLGGPALA